MDSLYGFFGPFAMGVADKYLSEQILVHQADDMGYPIFIQFIENIVQKQDRHTEYLCLHKLELGKLQGDQKGLLLSLTPEFLNGVSINFHTQVVFVDSLAGILQNPVFFLVFPEQIREKGRIQLALIPKFYRFVPS